ncbi:MAG: regulator [Comamonadaceae bacterium CG12_big_fil_rev_8_21_14_0_65_59_15]|jgi:antitoxin PrlF|nr:MAG: regulator [Comamonadaceae bacterium CG12_big_fil_rev_8_21_14_0_65_59_15]
MPAILEAQSSLTERYQTTVPESVRRRLKLGKRDKILYTIRPDGDVVLSRALPAEDQDPILGQFLDFLARDMANNPQHLQPLDEKWLDRVRALTEGVEVELNTPLSAEDE